MMLLFLIMRCTPTIRELIAATPLSLSSQRLPASRLLLPRSGLELSDFVPWRKAAVHTQAASRFPALNLPRARAECSATKLDSAAGNSELALQARFRVEIP
jgi:hypothetical protein